MAEWFRLPKQRFLETLEKSVYASLIAAIASPSLVLAPIFIYLRHQLISALSKPVVDWQVRHVATFLTLFIILGGCLVLFGSIISKKKKTLQPPKRYDFVESDGVLWKQNFTEGYVESDPYCSKERVKMKERYAHDRNRVKFECLSCGLLWDRYRYEYTNILDRLRAEFDAINSGHYKKG